MSKDELEQMLPAVNGGEAGEGMADDRLLSTLERLLEIEAISLDEALDAATQQIAEALDAEKVDAFLLDAEVQTLVAHGTSDTPLGHKQRALGLDRLPLANGGRAVQVYRSGVPYLGGHEEDDAEELVGVREGLGIRSAVGVPLRIGKGEGGVLLVTHTAPDFFSERDLGFLRAVARWVGLVARRAELVEQVAEQARAQGRRMAAEELVMVVAHDLGNYLTPLKARIDLIARRAERRQQLRDREDAEIAARELDRLGRMITNLLDVARIEQGMLMLTPRPVDLAALVEDVAEALTTARNPVEVRAPEELVVTADLERVRQALENLVANAVRHSPEGRPVTVTVGQERRRDAEGRDDDWATITISDMGPGIASEVLPRLFTRFARGPGSSGLGIGLYLASEIAQAHGGTLGIDSQPGRGASFTLALPMTDDACQP